MNRPNTMIGATEASDAAEGHHSARAWINCNLIWTIGLVAADDILLVS
jgi:hypothetical protein